MIDLHSHSTASDGSRTPESLVDLAVERGLTALALTDHDTMDGVEPAQARAAGTSLTLLPGVEIEIESAAGEFHLLGLALVGDRSLLTDALVRLQAARRERNQRMVAKMQEAGVPITSEELARAAGGQIVSRAHFARLLVQKKVVSSIDAAFKRFLGKGKEFYEPRLCLPLREATDLIRGAGGVAVIAHPISLGLKGPGLRAHLSACKDQGVAGIEAWHPNHDVKQCHAFEKMARDLGMIVTGGSDYHGDHMPQRRLGLTAGGREIPDSLLDTLPSLHPTGG
jgi:predicted metal-dependent phosphoesterase TrpH